MDRKLIAELVRLRYKLMWAKTRSRNGKIALFLAGYLLLVMLLALMGLGGLSAGITAVQQGRSEQVAQIVFGGLFMEAIIAPLMLGFGMNAVFSDYELRRYPVTAMDRRLARHFIGILDPFWAIFLILELGLVVGLYAFGGGSFWAGLLAVLLLIVSNYMLARVIGLAIDRLVNRKGGAGILMGFVILLAFVPGLSIPALKHNPQVGAALLKALAYTPPFGAAALTTGAPLRALGGLGVIVWWLIGLAAVLVALEKRPPQRQTVATSKIQWETPYDRIARIFGPANAPLAAQWLRFCLRNNRFRVLYVLSLPLAGFITYQMGGKHSGPGLALSMFTAALSCFPWITFIGTSRIAVNQYGYAGGAFRRYQLLPSDPAASLRVGSYVNLLFGSLMLPAGALLWILFSPPPLLISRLLMLVLMGLAGLFLLHAAGLWATVFGPRKGNYTASFGNDMSAFGNVVVIGGVLLFMAPPPLLKELLPAALAPENWWWTLVAAAVCIGIYLFSLKTVSALLVSRREHLMAIVEGRQS